MGHQHDHLGALLAALNQSCPALNQNISANSSGLVLERNILRCSARASLGNRGLSQNPSSGSCRKRIQSPRCHVQKRPIVPDVDGRRSKRPEAGAVEPARPSDDLIGCQFGFGESPDDGTVLNCGVEPGGKEGPSGHHIPPRKTVFLCPDWEYFGARPAPLDPACDDIPRILLCCVHHVVASIVKGRNGYHLLGVLEIRPSLISGRGKIYEHSALVFEEPSKPGLWCRTYDAQQSRHEHESSRHAVACVVPGSSQREQTTAISEAPRRRETSSP